MSDHDLSHQELLHLLTEHNNYLDKTNEYNGKKLSLKSASIYELNLSGSNLNSAVFEFCLFDTANFSRCSFINSTFSFAILHKVVFSHGDFSGAILSANCTSCNFDNCIFDESTSFELFSVDYETYSKSKWEPKFILDIYNKGASICTKLESLLIEHFGENVIIKSEKELPIKKDLLTEEEKAQLLNGDFLL
ncbi:MAG: pentapeptide repeat-containing protein [Candidatus Cloacimonetes bacterium]|nr:pentapeptide repeat-containing protein [Candidatus Cloacimonadota bacterium]